MTATVHQLVPKLNIFSGIREANVAFCVDISGSMYNTLETVKQQLIEFLLDQAILARLNLNRMFNLFAFSTEVYPWANGLVLWNAATVNGAINWIKDLDTKTGTNTLDALVSAFSDENTQAVCLITDDVSDQEPYQVLNQASALSRGRPVHCIYVTSPDRVEDRAAIEFLQNLSSVTRGFFKIISVGRQGLEKITPVNTLDYASHMQLASLSLNASLKLPAQRTLTFVPTTTTAAVTQPTVLTQAAVATLANGVTLNTLNGLSGSCTLGGGGGGVVLSQPSSFAHPNWLQEPASYTYPKFVTYPRVLVTNEGTLPSKSIAWSRFRPVRVSSDGTVIGLSSSTADSLSVSNDIAYTPDAGSLLVNKYVLARSQMDGYYYKGKVINQVGPLVFIFE
jgi:hypothetical protein